MKNTDLRSIVETSLFAALIFLGGWRLWNPNAKFRLHSSSTSGTCCVRSFSGPNVNLAFTAASIGLGIFDLLNAGLFWETFYRILNRLA